jgi:hypothetical protein
MSRKPTNPPDLSDTVTSCGSKIAFSERVNKGDQITHLRVCTRCNLSCQKYAWSRSDGYFTTSRQLLRLKFNVDTQTQEGDAEYWGIFTPYFGNPVLYNPPPPPKKAFPLSPLHWCLIFFHRRAYRFILTVVYTLSIILLPVRNFEVMCAKL